MGMIVCGSRIKNTVLITPLIVWPLSGLPPAQIIVGDLDLFLKEDTDYANRLKRDGVETEFVEIKGAFHGMFSLGSGEPLSDEMWEKFAAFVKKYLLD